MATQEGHHVTAAEHISAAVSSLNGTELPNVEWQVYATAGRVFAALGRSQESEEARAHAVRVADRVATTLAGEPVLRQSLLSHVEGQLSLRASA
jgi:phosphoribosylamine-glycine ligase